MVKTTIDMFSSAFKMMYKATDYVVRGYTEKDRLEGARFLNSNEENSFLLSGNKGLLLDGTDKRLSVSESYQNVCFTARVGAGKTTKYTIPNVLDKAQSNSSLIIHDPKGEVHKLTSRYMEAMGYNTILTL